MRQVIDFLTMQRGPMGSQTTPNTGILVALGIIVVILSVIIILTWFPRLTGVRPSLTIEPKIEHQDEIVFPTDVGGALERESALEVALRLLEPDEILIVKALEKAGGSMLQKDISYELEFSRVKTHRVLVRLLKRGVVTAEKHFNTNRIELADWLKE
jgi:uncharacterized membrane protein